MDKKYIQENEIDIKYLRGQLAEDELEQFEIYLMEHPDCLESIEIVSVFNETVSEGMNIRQRDGQAVNYLIATKQKFWSSLRVAAIFLAGIGFMNIYSNIAPEQGDTRIAYLSQLRSGNDYESIATINLPKSGFRFFSDQKFVIVVRTDDQSASSFEGLISSLDDQREISLGTIKPDQFGDVVLALNTRRFPAGKYRLRLMNKSNVSFEQVFKTEIE